MDQIRRAIISLGAVVVSLAAAPPASADNSAVCTLKFVVEFGETGAIRQTAPGEVRCAGQIGTSRIDPTGAAVYLTGSATKGSTGCAPNLTGGRFYALANRFFAFEPRPSAEFEGEWWAEGPGPVEPASGIGSADGLGISFFGVARFVPLSGQCAAQDLAPGTIYLDLVFDTGSARASRTPSQYPDPDPRAGSTPPPAAQPKAGSAYRKPRRCRPRSSAKPKGTRRCRNGRRPQAERSAG